MASTLISCLVFAIFTSQTTASHFRGGIITWKPDESIANKVTFNFRLGFRRSSRFCDSAMVAQQSIVGSGGNWYANHDLGIYSGLAIADTGFHCTDFSVNEDWSQGENTFNYTFPDEGPWLISYSSCCWISLTNGGSSWFLSTTVNLTIRHDNGKINSSPISAISPIVRIQQGCPRTISIPAEDSDGDKVRCRWSTGSQRECGDVCNRFFYSGTLDEEKCTLSLHSNAALGWHAVAITLEDFPASTTNFQMATPFSHVSLQFLVHVAPSSGPCNRAPVLTGQSPIGGSCEEVPDGDTFYSIIEAKHIDSSRRIAEIITVTPLYMHLTSLLNYTDHVGDTVYYKNVSWNPKSSQKGRHIFCFKAIDEYGMESDERCITILVGSNNTPKPILSSRAPVIPTLSRPWGFGYVDFNITFDQQIKRPRHSKFIQIILEGHVIYKLDTRSSSAVTINQDGSLTLQFRVPQVVLSMQGNYSITLDRGAVVGLGCTSDGPPSPAISSRESWTFDVGVCAKGTFIDHSSYNCNDVDECSNPPSILSRKKRSHWHWYYGYYSSSSQESSSNLRTTDITPSSAFSAAITSTVSASECSNHSYLEDYERRMGFYNGYYGYVKCDNNLQFGWYRFRGAAGTQMPTSCVGQYRCGTRYPGWLNGAHPSVADGIVHATVCFNYYYGCCSRTKSIRVRNCGGFYVYELGPPPVCYARYCGNGEANYSATTSATSMTTTQESYSNLRTTDITPSSAFSAAITSTMLASECSNHSYLEEYDRRMDFYGNYQQCDNNLQPGWYRFRGAAGTQMPTSCVGEYRCGTSAPGWLNGAHPSVADGIVHATVCFNYYYYGCCSWRKSIRVRNCGGFYVYELGPPPGCYMRYCGNGRANYSATPSATSMSTTQELSSSISTFSQATPAMYSSPKMLISTSSVNIHASVATVTPAASRAPFVLHLPAKCDHNCANTWGSYYCSCRQGYKLQADRKTCLDINECATQNGGCTHLCINTPGSHYCKCPGGTTVGFDNKTCHEPGINVKCADEAMFIFLERKSFQGFDPSKLTLLYPSCRASYNATHITLQTSLNDCGTTHNESEDTITFYNKVQSVQFSSGNVITREQNVSIAFYCSYGRKALVRNPSFKRWKNIFTASEGGYGNFTFMMDLYKTQKYHTPYSRYDYPITVNLKDELFIQIAVKSNQSNLVVFPDTCKATPSSDPYSVPQYIFIQRGCSLDSTLKYSYSISSEQRFSIQAFRFIEDHPVVHFHCEVLACHRNTARSRCLQGCSRYRGRRDEEPGSESTQVYEMYSGPIKFKKRSSGKLDKQTEGETNMATIAAVASAGGVCLLVAIALAVVVIQVKKRFKGALADRNKVYAMEQFNKYVKEENDNGGFAQDDAEVNGSGEQNINMTASA